MYVRMYMLTAHIDCVTLLFHTTLLLLNIISKMSLPLVHMCTYHAYQMTLSLNLRE